MASGNVEVPLVMTDSILSGSIKDIKKTGIYYIGGNVADKPTSNGGVLFIGFLNERARAGILVTQYSTECYAIRIVDNTVSYVSLIPS